MSEDMEWIKEYQKVIRDILSAFKSVSFPVIVESSTGYKLISINRKRDKDLIKDISLIAREITNRYHTSPVTRETYSNVIGKKPKSLLDLMK